MATINKWKIFCITENTWSYGYLDSTATPPTTCFNNTSHTVNPDSISIVETISPNTVTISENDPDEPNDIGDNYITEGYSVDLPANTITTKQISWPIPINVLSTNYSTLDTHIGDIIDIVSNSINIGTVTANVSIGDTVLTVSSTVVNAAIKGYEILITDGTNTDFLDSVISINKNNNTITIRQSPTHTFSIGSLIKIQKRIMKNVEIGMSWLYEPSRGRIVGTRVKANQTLNIKYNNKSTSVDKRITFNIQYLY